MTVINKNWANWKIAGKLNNVLTGDGLGEIVNPTTAAETAAGVTPDDRRYRAGETGRYPNGLADALLVAVEATATVERNILLTEDLSIGTGEEIVVTSTGTSIASRGISVRALPGVYIVYSGDGVAVTIGSSAAVSRNVYWNVPILRTGQDWDDGTDTTSYGMRLIRVDRSEIHVDIEGFNVGLHLYGDTGGNVHNKFFVRELLDNRIHILLDRNGSSEGWNNSNRFWGGIATWRSGTIANVVSNAIVIKAIDQADDADNHNLFYVDVECAVAGALHADATMLSFAGEYNTFDARLEVTNTHFTQIILFTASGNSEQNVVRIGRGSGTALELSGKVSNLGLSTNRVYYGNVTLYGTDGEAGQNTQSGNYTVQLTDAGKTIYTPGAGPYTWSLALDTSIPYPNGFRCRMLNIGGGTVTISFSGALRLVGGDGTDHNMTLSSPGYALLEKVSTSSWIIDGTGLTEV